MGKRLRVAVVDDHPVIVAGLPSTVPQLDVVAGFLSVEQLLASEAPEYDAVLLDLQLDGSTRDGQRPLMGTAAVRALLEAGKGPVVIYTSITEDMLLAGCLAAGASGAASKLSAGDALADVVRHAVDGRTWVDSPSAGALSALVRGHHVGALSPQQAGALRLRAQGLKQKAIATRIGVKDEETVHRYLRAAVDKLADGIDAGRQEADRNAGALAEEIARRAGLAGDLVRWEDIDARQRRSRRRP